MKTYDTIDRLLAQCNGPVLIVSTHVGRGVYAIGEVIKEKLARHTTVYHMPIEQLTSSSINHEDVVRYRWISDKFPFLLRLIYTLPIFYYRKYLREKYIRTSELSKLKEYVESYNIRTVFCISHRPAFWISNLKRKYRMSFSLWGLLIEYGYTLGWRYIFWKHVNTFLSPIPRNGCPYPFPSTIAFHSVLLPAHDHAYALASQIPSKDTVLIVCGYWGQGPITRIIKALYTAMPTITIHAVCGENNNLYVRATALSKKYPTLSVYNTVTSILPLLRDCASIITKPGISTLLEAHAAQRKIFLLKGMPVAEDNNARYAIRHFNAEWFSIRNFIKWQKGHYENTAVAGRSQY